MSTDAILERCGGGDVTRVMVALSEEPASCFPYSAPTLLTGVWVRGFEYSEFFEGARSFGEVADRINDQDDPFTWFSPSWRADADLGELPPPDDGEAFRVEVIGRRSLCEYGYGHLGVGTHEVIADHILSAVPLTVTR